MFKTKNYKPTFKSLAKTHPKSKNHQQLIIRKKSLLNAFKIRRRNSCLCWTTDIFYPKHHRSIERHRVITAAWTPLRSLCNHCRLNTTVKSMRMLSPTPMWFTPRLDPTRSMSSTTATLSPDRRRTKSSSRNNENPSIFDLNTDVSIHMRFNMILHFLNFKAWLSCLSFFFSSLSVTIFFKHFFPCTEIVWKQSILYHITKSEV